MARKPVIYEQAVITVGGALLTDAATIAITYADSDEQIAILGLKADVRRAMTVAPGARMMVIEVMEFVPVAGSDFDPVKAYLEVAEIDVTVVLLGSGASLITRGFVVAPKISAGVGQNLTQSWSLVGPPSAFEKA